MFVTMEDSKNCLAVKSKIIFTKNLPENSLPSLGNLLFIFNLSVGSRVTEVVSLITQLSFIVIGLLKLIL